jgi:SlyX protein
MTDAAHGPADLIARIESLEINVAHQNSTIADLDRVVTAQWAEIDRLKRLISELTDRLGDTEARVDEAMPQKPPPHY